MRHFLLLSLVALTACMSPTPDLEVARNQPLALQAFAKKVLADPKMAQTLSQCPGNLLPAKAYAHGGRECEKNRSACLSACLSGDGDACFGAARVFEQGGTRPYSEITYRLFATACAAGNANGCTNAAATVKNGRWSGTKPSAPATKACQFKSYDRACKAGSTWGCTMRGREYEAQTPPNRAAARRSYERACALGPTTSACSAARPGIARLSGG